MVHGVGSCAAEDVVRKRSLDWEEGERVDWSGGGCNNVGGILVFQTVKLVMFSFSSSFLFFC